MSSVKVAVRVRPFNKREKDRKAKLIIQMKDKATQIIAPNSGKKVGWSPQPLARATYLPPQPAEHHGFVVILRRWSIPWQIWPLFHVCVTATHARPSPLTPFGWPAVLALRCRIPTTSTTRTGPTIPRMTTSSVSSISASNASWHGTPGRCRPLTGLCFLVFPSPNPPWLRRSAGQEQVYQDVGIELLDHSFEGYNCCIFA